MPDKSSRMSWPPEGGQNNTKHSGNRKRWRQAGSRQSTPLSTRRTRYGNSRATPGSHMDLQNPQNSLQKGSRYGISVSTPHRRYGHDCGRRFASKHYVTEILGALKGTELRWQREPKTQIFAENHRFHLEIPAFGGRRKPQKTEDFRRKPQETADCPRNLFGLF